MSLRPLFRFRSLFPRMLLCGALVGCSAFGAKPLSDILPASRRAVAVETAQRLAAPRDPAPLPPDLVNPFSPPNFQAPDPEELRAAAEAARRAATTSTGPARPSNDRELLAAIAPQIRAGGVISLGGELILLVGSKKVRAGDVLSVTYDGLPYALTISAIDRTSFTLRLNRAEFTRPIKLGTNP